MNIILFGFKGCGKTTIGKLLADKLAMQFVDIDRVIENIYFAKYHAKLSVREIYKKLGEDDFRNLEKEAILSLVDLNNTIIATGGGSVLDADNLSKLKKLGTLVYLQSDKSNIKKRILSETLPAFLDPNDLEGSFEEMYKNRKNIYENIAVIVINTEGMDNEAIIKKIIYEVKNG